jgi:quinol monooxygenase YgiN
MTVRVVARFPARPDTVNELRGVLMSMLAPTRSEHGCFRSELLQNLTDPTDFTFVEEWRTADDVALHMQMPHHAAALAKINDLVADALDVQTYRVIG